MEEKDDGRVRVDLDLSARHREVKGRLQADSASAVPIVAIIAMAIVALACIAFLAGR
jgi:hypothetical protein